MAVSIAGVFWRAARSGELAYGHTRKPLETANIHEGVLDVRIHGDNHVLAGYASASISSPIATLRRLGPGPSCEQHRDQFATICALSQRCVLFSSLRRLRGKSLRRGRDILSHSRS